MSEPVFVSTELVDAAADNRIDALYRKGLAYFEQTLRQYHSPEHLTDTQQDWWKARMGGMAEMLALLKFGDSARHQEIYASTHDVWDSLDHTVTTLHTASGRAVGTIWIDHNEFG